MESATPTRVQCRGGRGRRQGRHVEPFAAVAKHEVLGRLGSRFGRTRFSRRLVTRP
jgi:hypothetical protein